MSVSGNEIDIDQRLMMCIVDTVKMTRKQAGHMTCTRPQAQRQIFPATRRRPHMTHNRPMGHHPRRPAPEARLKREP
jgi:hypothetical protein